MHAVLRTSSRLLFVACARSYPGRLQHVGTVRSCARGLATRRNRSSVLATAVAALLCAMGRAQTTTNLSVSSTGNEGDRDSRLPSIADDGRWIAFVSEARNLVPDDSNGESDVFVHDRTSGHTERVSVDSSGHQADEWSRSVAISADGRFVAFGSYATNLVPGDTNGWEDVFVRDRLAGTTERVSVDSLGNEADWFSYCLAISGDGRYVVFESVAGNLVPGGTHGLPQIYLRDRQTSQTTLVSVDSNGIIGNGTSYEAAITRDGRYVAFTSRAGNLVPGDTNGVPDVFVRDLVNGQTTRVSVDSLGHEGHGPDGSSWVIAPAISDDGRYVAFDSDHTDLVPGDTNDFEDIFVHDRSTGITDRVSLHSLGAQGSDWSRNPSISADGRYITFDSHAGDLVSGDENQKLDVFLHDRMTGSTSLVSLGASGAQGNSDSEEGAISAGGRFVAFTSWATNLVGLDTNGHRDVFLRDLATGPVASFCYGDGNQAPCPCGNDGDLHHGCENSSTTGGAILTARGEARLDHDTLRVTSAGEGLFALSLLVQGDAAIAPKNLGDGLRCSGGTLKRLYVRNASLGVVTMPREIDPSISVRSAALGDLIPAGATRYYQVYYRDPTASFCPDPPGGTLNVSNGLSVVWTD